MESKEGFPATLFRAKLRWQEAVFATPLQLLLTLIVTMFTAQVTQGQTYRVIYNFTGGQDGGNPYAGLSMDQAGNLYGTTRWGGYGWARGTVFKLTRLNSGWVFTTIYAFQGGDEGMDPMAGVTVGPDGTLYGTTYAGGGQGCSGLSGCGTVFNLRASTMTPCRNSIFCPWTATVLHRFSGESDGALPIAGVTFDRDGNLYGTTTQGGTGDAGVVYKLTRTQTGWTESILHNFTGDADGGFPIGEVILDEAGNLYGTTAYGGQSNFCCGTVFQMVPTGSTWTKTVIHNFQVEIDGAIPQSGLVRDRLGNLFGTTAGAQTNTVFELTPSNGDWIETLLYIPDWYFSPEATLTLDALGNLYGSSIYGHNSGGIIFKLTHSGGDWAFTSVHDFAGGNDGSFPHSTVLLGPAGKLYGTAYWDGTHGVGVVWEITP